MSDQGRIYRVTAAGREAWEAQDTAVPTDYRRILWLMDFHGYGGVTKDLLRHFTKEVLDDWLEEIAELGLIEEADPETTVPAVDNRTPVLNQEHFLREAKSAGAELTRTGAYLAADRVASRRVAQKAPGDTVILLVEDDPDQRALADLRLTLAGYKVRVAASVQAFLQAMLDDGAPDLLLLDVELPDGDGFEVLAKMRRHQSYGALPIVMLTAKNDPADIGRGLVLGADGYITKPYTRNILADIIRRVLKQDR
jgi:CheY-like chemotaxis protein